MDQPLPPRPGRRLRLALAAFAAVAVIAAGASLLMPRGLLVSSAGLRIASAERGMFRDDMALRVVASPLQSVVLDAVESGRVEEVPVLDGAVVAQGDALFRLSNPQRRLELLQREAEHAQQISNLANLRVNMEAARAGRQRRIADMEFALAQAEKQHARARALAAQGYVSAAAQEESADRVEQQRRLLANERSNNTLEAATQAEAVRQMEAATARLEAGLKLVHAAIDALVVRAPAAGRLTDFRLKVGETVVPGQHIGRIDDQARFKLEALVDEFYLPRLVLGRQGSAEIDGRSYETAVTRIYPQVKDGRFAIELSFAGNAAPPLSPGQAVEATITLGGAQPALLLPNEAFVNDSAGAWAYVLEADGKGAARRALRLGRRNNTQVEVVAGLQPGERVIVSGYARFGTASYLQFDTAIPISQRNVAL
jgi:HlyD family secretion protein